MLVLERTMVAAQDSQAGEGKAPHDGLEAVILVLSALVLDEEEVPMRGALSRQILDKRFGTRS